MVQTFIKHILGVGTKHSGLYGDTDGYYGTVEEQGRLTLHLHMLLWIKGSLSPQQIRQRLEQKDSEFQQALISYLENTHQGGYMDATAAEISTNIAISDYEVKGLPNPTLTLPMGPPDNTAKWWQQYKSETNELIFRCNRHTCHPGCRSSKYPDCKSRFPRETRAETTVDEDASSILLKHDEENLNTFSPLLTYLSRCNTDVTSLLSGTAIKAATAYITNYITKSPLKTHIMFEVIKGVFNRNSEYLEGDDTMIQKARKLMVQIVNALTVKQEVGGPLASLYLLGNPDHYTNFLFKPFFWKSYVNEVRTAWQMLDTELNLDPMEDQAKVIIGKVKGSVVAISPILDYTLRPVEHKDMHPTRKETQHPQFLHDHPHHDTHSVRLHPQRKVKVPCFIGVLPRPDKGNYEEYCMTMLTLFKPWRTGHNLKREAESWEDSFNSHCFTDRQKEIMQFMNIRHECYDARDDFRAQRIKAEPFKWPK
ncbi:hypothetical protein DENSPDRAFT_862104 [Dentipellis sp. KUC8613]|nr:hypothetical protein DENSPDRAFT_862104 [Dentipellis sp. KUC8613]